MRLLSSIVWNRLKSRLNIEDDGLLDGKSVAEVISPVTSVDELLAVAKSAKITADLRGAAGTYVAYHTVPKGKRWKLKVCRRQATTGSSVISIKYGVAVKLPLDGSGTAAATVGLHDLRINEGDSIGMETTNDAGDGSIYLILFYDEEDAY